MARTARDASSKEALSAGIESASSCTPLLSLRRKANQSAVAKMVLEVSPRHMRLTSLSIRWTCFRLCAEPWRPRLRPDVTQRRPHVAMDNTQSETGELPEQANEPTTLRRPNVGRSELPLSARSWRWVRRKRETRQRWLPQPRCPLHPSSRAWLAPSDRPELLNTQPDAA